MVKKLRVNQQIRISPVRLIDEGGGQLGVVELKDAMRLAGERGYDLVEVSAASRPPVCRLMDYGSYLYKQKKLEKQQKRTSKKSGVKGIRLSYRTDKHDMEIKANQAKEFLKEKNLVKVIMIFRGRELSYTDAGREKILQFASMVSETGEIEEQPKMHGFQMVMVLKPKH